MLGIRNWFARRRATREKARRLKTPPGLPYRCGTMLIRARSPEAAAAIGAAWAKGEDEYCDWVAAHPNPEHEWVKTAERIRQLRQAEHEVNRTFGGKARL